MKIQLIRHATLLLKIGGLKLLVDPMFSPIGAMDPVNNSSNHRRNPLVELPHNTPALDTMDAVIVTHMHRDHFDHAAARQLPKQIPIFCQPEDEQKMKDLGFSNPRPIFETANWNGISLTRTKGQHGKSEIATAMGPVSGYIVEAASQPSLYIAGDTIWCSEVEEALNRYKPRVTVVNGGSAQFVSGGPITMSAEDIDLVCRKAPKTHVIVVHMEAWNHCLLSRQELRQFAEQHGVFHQVHIPEDGEWMEYT